MAEAVRSRLCGRTKEELSCAICLEMFYMPKVLPCKHTFCQDCLQDWAGGQKSFQCPVCHAWAEPSAKGVVSDLHEHVPDGHLVKNLGDQIHNQATVSEESAAGQPLFAATRRPKDQARPPTKRVLPDLPDGHLVKNLCDQIHNQATVSEESAAEQPLFTNNCSRHPKEELNLHCNDCSKAICTECLGEAHAGHSAVNLEKALEERITEDQALIVEGRGILETYCDFIISLRGTEKQLEKQKQQTESSITQAYSQVVQKLQEVKDDMIGKVEQKHHQNLAGIQSQREGVLADLSELSAACDSAEHNIQQRGMGVLGQDTSLIQVA
ncbi:tripartite motif-containing protein 3-like [Branchiostoma floridae x Branchiostoma belcheri]